MCIDRLMVCALQIKVSIMPFCLHVGCKFALVLVFGKE